MNDRKDAKDDRKGHKEVKEDKNEVNEVNDDKQNKEVKDGKQEVKAKKLSSSSESRKQDDKCKVEIKVNIDKEEKSSKCEHSSSKSSSEGENDKEKSSNRKIKSETTADAKKAKSEHRKRSGSPLSALDGSLAKKWQDSMTHLPKVTSVEMKEDLSLSSKSSNQVYSKSALQKLMDELDDISSDDEDDITDTVDIFSQQNGKDYFSYSSDSSLQSKDDFWGEISGSDSDMDLDIRSTSSTSKTSNPISSKSALQILMDELKYILSDDDVATVDIFSQQKPLAKNSPLVESGKASPALPCKCNSEKPYKASSENASTIRQPTTPKDSQEEKSTSEIDSIFDVKSQAKTVVKDLDMKQKPNEERMKDRKEANTKENSPCNFVTEGISCSEQAPNEEELIQLAELRKILMGITDLSVLQKAVKLILSTGYFEIKDTFDSDMRAVHLNAIRQLQSFVATKIY